MLMLAARHNLVNKNREIGGLFDSQLHAAGVPCSHRLGSTSFSPSFTLSGRSFRRTITAMMRCFIAVLMFSTATNLAGSGEAATTANERTSGQTSAEWTRLFDGKSFHG